MKFINLINQIKLPVSVSIWKEDDYCELRWVVIGEAQSLEELEVLMFQAVKEAQDLSDMRSSRSDQFIRITSA